MKNILLKIFILVALSASSLFSASLSPNEIKNMVSEIKKERVGITLNELDTTENPFIIKVPKKEEIKEIIEQLEVLTMTEVVYKLKAILNKAAFIDTKWYKQGDSIGNYKVGYVSSDAVVLNGDDSSKTLSLKKKKNSFIKSNRGYR